MDKSETVEFIEDKLGWCGCGMPESATELLQKVLQIINDRSEKSQWDGSVDKIKNLLSSELYMEAVFYWFMYFLDDKGLTEHGGSVGGCWLSEKGKTLLAALNEHGCNLWDNIPNWDDRLKG